VIQRRTDYDVGHKIVSEQFGAVAPSHRPAAPMTINVETVEVIEAGRSFAYRRARYRVRAIDWWDGCVLEYLVDQIVATFEQRLTRENLEQLETMYERAYALMWKSVEPCGRTARIRRLIDPDWNPFLRMTNAEFTALASFCFECRTRLPDLALDTTPGSPRDEHSRPSILPTRTRSLFENSRRGRTRVADR
jgi:hypothetical protein